SLDPAQWRSRIGRMQALVKECPPIVGLDAVERRYHVIEVKGLQCGRSSGSSVECPAEIVERLHSFAELADERVNLQPDQRAFRIEIPAAAVVGIIVPRT